jgi:hypothetical protein
MGPKERRSSVLSAIEEAAIVALQVQARLPLDDMFTALKNVLPHLTRSSLHRCLQRHGISRLSNLYLLLQRPRGAALYSGNLPPKARSRNLPAVARKGEIRAFLKRTRSLPTPGRRADDPALAESVTGLTTVLLGPGQPVGESDLRRQLGGNSLTCFGSVD